MALDHQAQGVLTAFVDSVPEFGSIPVEELRDRLVRGRPTGIVPEPVAEVDDLESLGGVRYRRYRSTDQPVGTVVWLHGGGFVAGDTDGCDAVCRAMANSLGADVVSVDYPLAPEHPFPSGLMAAVAVTTWIAEEHPWTAEPLPVVIGGESAGGNLAAVCAILARDRGGPALAAQALICPVIDSRCDTASYEDFATGYLLTASGMRWCWQEYLAGADGDDPFASPLRVSDLSGLPPALVVTADHDPLRDEGRTYAQSLADAGVPVTETCYPSTFHGFAGAVAAMPSAREARSQLIAFLRSAFERTSSDTDEHPQDKE